MTGSSSERLISILKVAVPVIGALGVVAYTYAYFWKSYDQADSDKNSDGKDDMVEDKDDDALNGTMWKHTCSFMHIFGSSDRGNFKYKLLVLMYIYSFLPSISGWYPDLVGRFFEPF